MCVVCVCALCVRVCVCVCVCDDVRFSALVFCLSSHLFFFPFNAKTVRQTIRDSVCVCLFFVFSPTFVALVRSVYLPIKVLQLHIWHPLRASLVYALVIVIVCVCVCVF